MLYLIAGPVLRTLYFWAGKSETITNFTAENKVWRQHLTKEYKLSEVLLQKFEYGQVDLLTATKESLSTERALSLQRPDVDLFLAISKCAMA